MSVEKIRDFIFELNENVSVFGIDEELIKNLDISYNNRLKSVNGRFIYNSYKNTYRMEFKTSVAVAVAVEKSFKKIVAHEFIHMVQYLKNKPVDHRRGFKIYSAHVRHVYPNIDVKRCSNLEYEHGTKPEIDSRRENETQYAFMARFSVPLLGFRKPDCVLFLKDHQWKGTSEELEKYLCEDNKFNSFRENVTVERVKVIKNRVRFCRNLKGLLGARYFVPLKKIGEEAVKNVEEEQDVCVGV